MGDDGPPGVADGVAEPVAERARYTTDVGPGSAGVRVVVRYRLADGGLADGGLADGGLTDILGVLLSWGGGVLRVQRHDGAVVTVAEIDVVAAKQVPPAPERRR